MPVDFTTYTEVEEIDDIQKTATHVDFIDRRNRTTYLYRDFGAGYFTDFIHWLDLTRQTHADSAWIAAWMLSNALKGEQVMRDDDDPYIAIIIGGSVPNIKIADHDAGGTIHTSAGKTMTLTTKYYLRLEKVGTTFYLDVFSTANLRAAGGRGDGDWLSESLVLQADYSMRYQYTGQSHDDGGAQVGSSDMDNLIFWGSENLAAQFIVRQPSENLPAEFTVRQSGISNLPAEFFIPIPASKDLAAGFSVRPRYYWDYEDFTTYTEVDVGANRIRNITPPDYDVVSVDIDEVVHLSKRYGTDYFTGDFFHDITINLISGVQNGRYWAWVLADAADSYDSLPNNILALRMMRLMANPWRITLIEKGVISDTYDHPNGANTTFYFTIYRKADQFGCRLYSNAARTTLLGHLGPVTLSGSNDFNYLLGCSEDLSLGGRAITLNISNLLLGGGTYSEDLPAQFYVTSSGSEDLPAQFEVPTNSEDLACEFAVRRSSSLERLGKLIVRHSDSEELAGEFIVRQVGSQDLPASFDAQATQSLLAEFIVRHSNAEDLAAELSVRRSASTDLAAKLWRGVDDSEDLGTHFDVHYRRIFGENWQRKCWFDDPYYWRSYYDLALDSFVFEYIHKTGLSGNVWTENVSARIDCSGFASAAIDADFSVRGPRSGVPITIIYSDGHDAWVAESDEASVLGWAWENTTKVFDAIAPDWYRRVGILADRKTPTVGLYVVAVYYDDAPGAVQYVRFREQTNPLDITAWDAIEDVSNTANTDKIRGVAGRSMGATGAAKKEVIVVYKEGIAIRSRYHTSVGGWQAIQDIDTTTHNLKSLACFDVEHYTIPGVGDNEIYICYVDADGSVIAAERPAGIASVWQDFDTLDASTSHHANVAIVEVGPILFFLWQDDHDIGYRMHRDNPNVWWPDLADPYNEFEPDSEAVVTTTSQPEQMQGPDDIAAGDAVAIAWVGLIAGAAGIGWGILQPATSEALPARFAVRRTATPLDLAASFDAQATQSLSAELVVRQAASQDLFAQFHPGQDRENLLGELIVRHPASQELAASFEAQVSLALPAELSARRSTQQNLAAKFVVNQSSEDLPAEFIVRGTGAGNLPAQFEVIQWLDLSAAFEVRTADSGNLLGEFIVRHADSQELAAEFEISYDDSEELLGSFQARITSDDNAIVIAVNPNAWINYSLGVGTGFLDGPYLGPDNVQKVYGASSLAFLSEYLKNRYDSLKFGWLKDPADTSSVSNMWTSGYPMCVEDIEFVDRIIEHWDWDEQTIITDIIEDTYTRLSWWVPGGNGGWSYANTNYGAQDNLRCSKFYDTPPGSGDSQRDDEEIFIKFYLGSLGVASLERLAYARIELYRYAGDPYAKSRLNARRIAECFETSASYITWNPANTIGTCTNVAGPHPWDETNIKWMNSGRSAFTMGGGVPYMGLPSFTKSSPTSRYGLTTDNNVWDMIRITDLLEGWLDGSHKNEGLAILAESIDGGDSSQEMNTFFTTPRWYSSRAAHANKPRVRLQYIPEDSVGRWSFENPDRWEINVTDPYVGTGALHLIDWSKVSYDESRTNQSSVTLVTDYPFSEGVITTRYKLNAATYPRLRYAVTPNKYVEYTTARTNFFNIYIRYQDSSNYYRVQLRAAGESSTILRRRSAGDTTLTTFDSGLPAGTVWSKIRVFWAVDGTGQLNICCFLWNEGAAIWNLLATGVDADNEWDTGGDITFESYDAEIDETIISERVL